MKMFKDSADRQWSIALTVGSVKRVKDQLEGAVDLLDPTAGDPPLFTKLSLDDGLLVGVLFALMEPQALTAGVSPEQFAEAMDGRAMADAQEAFYTEWQDFFHQRRKEAFAGMIEKQAILMRTTLDAATKSVERIDMATVTQKIQTIFGDTSSSAPAPQAATPGNTALAN